MSNKKLIAVLILSLIIINLLALTLVKAQEAPPGLPSGMENPEEYIEQARNKTLTKWEYLGKEWKNILRNNTIIKATDNFLTNNKYASISFRILFGVPYSLSITIFIIIFLWIIFFFESSRLINAYAVDSEALSLILGLFLTVCFAQIKLFLYTTKMLGWIFYAKKAWWWHVFVVIVEIVLIALVVFLLEWLKKWLGEKKKLLAEKTTKLAQKGIKKFFEKFRKSED